ncbi:hypothetical protein NT6N_23550 [Oceaniferula spumae]|uniref:Uncharacterized protein n=1 Tax=Oceaniferula spumae TaxID=2979115 RepID=A0AAT9FMR8_9BACT
MTHTIVFWSRQKITDSDLNTESDGVGQKTD